jgi:hypothetical protein
MVECVFSMSQALGSILTTTKKKRSDGGGFCFQMLPLVPVGGEA